jgi:GNAT superfamily N-acetyltransferase
MTAIDKPAITLRNIESADPALIAAQFAKCGWHKPESQYQRYFEEQTNGSRVVIIAHLNESFAGYGTIVWSSNYPSFRNAGIPEIVDSNVLPPFRRHGVATAIMDEAELQIAERSSVVGIGVGLYADYGPAQRMYVRRGYVPDANGSTWLNRPILGGQTVIADDDLILWLTKQLR